MLTLRVEYTRLGKRDLFFCRKVKETFFFGRKSKRDLNHEIFELNWRDVPGPYCSARHGRHIRAPVASYC